MFRKGEINQVQTYILLSLLGIVSIFVLTQTFSSINERTTSVSESENLRSVAESVSTTYRQVYIFGKNNDYSGERDLVAAVKVNVPKKVNRDSYVVFAENDKLYLMQDNNKLNINTYSLDDVSISGEADSDEVWIKYYKPNDTMVIDDEEPRRN